MKVMTLLFCRLLCAAELCQLFHGQRALSLALVLLLTVQTDQAEIN